MTHALVALLATDFGWNAETVSAIGAVLAAIALVPAVVAARSASSVYRLEANPYIVVEPGSEMRRLAEQSGRALRCYEYEIHSTEENEEDIVFATTEQANKVRPFYSDSVSGLVAEDGSSIPPPTAFIAVRNVGRSPAVRLWLDARLRRRTDDGEWLHATEITFAIDALPPGEVLIRLRNYSSVTLEFAIYRAAHDPRQRKSGKRVDMRKKRELMLASLAIFRVKANPSAPRQF